MGLEGVRLDAPAVATRGISARLLIEFMRSAHDGKREPMMTPATLAVPRS